jgi:diguanylate cyclase
MATHKDSLTGLPTRSALDATLKQSLDATSPLALAVLDVDNFVGINSNYGRETGDRVLQTLATLLSEAAPESVYRITGDEFAVLMPGLSLEQAFLRMETIRTHVQGAADQFGLPDGRAVTIGIGVAQYPRDAKDPQGLLQAADAALGSAKENGSNQVNLPPNEEMVMKSCYYPATSLRRLKALAERLSRKESPLLREALDDLFRKYDVPREA